MPGPEGPAHRGWLGVVTGIRLIHVIAAGRAERDGVFLAMAALRSRCGHYILPCGFFFFFIFSPNLSGRRVDLYHTSTHGVALVRI